MVAKTDDKKKKKVTNGDESLLLASAAIVPSAADDLIDFDLTDLFGGPDSGKSFFDRFDSTSAKTPDTGIQTPIDTVMDFGGDNAPSLAMDGLMVAGGALTATTLAANIMPDKTKPVVVDADLETSGKKSAIPVEGGRGKFGEIAGLLTTGAMLGTYLFSNEKAAQANGAPMAADMPATGFDLMGEFAHWSQIVGHGVQNGLVQLVGSAEDIYDLADNLTGDVFLPGNSKTNSTTEVLEKFADENLIRAPELRNEFERAAHGVSEFATYLVPLGGAAHMIGATAKAIKAVEITDRTLDVGGALSNLNGLGINSTGKNIPELAVQFAANGGDMALQSAQTIFNPNVGGQGIPGMNHNTNLDFSKLNLG